MKKIIAIALTLITTLTLTACGSTASIQPTEQPVETAIPTKQIEVNTTYTKYAEVVNISNDEVTFETIDSNDWVWIMEEGENFNLYETYELTFDSLGNTYLYDDEIVTIK